MNIPRREIIAYVALAVLLITAAAGLRHRTINVDIVAFICGGEAVRQHADPYVMQPLLACEQRRLAELGRPELAEAVTPAPLPIYALLPFAALSVFTTKIAVGLWDALLIASTCLSIVLLRKMTNIAVPTLIAAIFVGGIYVSLALGQIVPVVIACIVTAAWAVQRGNDLLASIAAAITMCEPNVGLPVCTSLFVIRSGARIPLVIAGVVVAGASLLAAPLPQTLGYFHEILPAHASSEIHNDEQLSFTHLLALSGASDRIAVLGGSLSYLLLLVFGTALSFFVSRQKNIQHVALVLAPAVTTLGGTFLHVHQFAIVSVLALLVSSISHESRKARYGLLLVALPLIAAGTYIDIMIFTCIVVIISADLFIGDVRSIATASVATIAATSIVRYIRAGHTQSPEQAARLHTDVAIATQHARIPEDVWRVFINEHVFTLLGWNAIGFDVPLIAGAVLTILATWELTRRRPQIVSTTIEGGI